MSAPGRQPAGEAQRAVALSRDQAVRTSDALHAAGYARAEADAIAAIEANASAKSVRRWRAAVRGRPPGERLAALMDRHRSGRPSAIDDEMHEELVALLHEFGEHLTARHAHRTLVARCGRAPSRPTVRRFLARYRREHAHELSAVTNPDRHRSHRKPAGGDAAAHVERLNQEWELDSSPADVICADGRRHAIVGALDVWSRRGRVLVVPTSRATAIAALLRRCILDWGLPETVRTDEGKDYTSRHLLGVLADLEIDHDRCPPYSPDAKPFVERFLGTLTRDLFAFLPGFTGHDVAQAQALRARKSFAQRRAERARSARCAERARSARCEDDVEIFDCTLTAEELQAHCDTWCDAVYGREPHAGLGGLSPFERAASWAGPVRRVPDERALDMLLAAPAGDGWRTVRKEGIRLDNVDYIAGPLGALVGERVQVRQDPADLDRILVYRASGSFVCIAEDPARTGADRLAVAAAMKASGNRRDRRARAHARDLSKRLRPEHSIHDVLAHATREAGGGVALPRKADAHETPALHEAARAAETAQAADAEAAAPAPQGVRAARRRIAAANRFHMEEDEGWLR